MNTMGPAARLGRTNKGNLHVGPLAQRRDRWGEQQFRVISLDQRTCKRDFIEPMAQRRVRFFEQQLQVRSHDLRTQTTWQATFGPTG